MKSFVSTFTHEKSTKNTERFQEDAGNEPPKIGVLYIQKWAIGNAQKIKVTVEVVE